ncbi:MAG: TetR/AcrR family transcriptional regulator [Bradymonadaceae bacterium]|nr:TetR/AcrR family transcriptional regulator [Lujinxingiaceae bacterium]
MVRPRFENLDEDKQEEILEAAGEEFATKGYEQASINQIIGKAGISKGSLYYYFEDKSDLFATVMTKASERFVKMAGGLDFEALTAENFWETLEGLSRKSFKLTQTNTWYIRMARAFYAMRHRHGDHKGPAAKIMQWALNYQESLLRRGQELGVVRVDIPMEMLNRMTFAMGDAGDQWLMERWDTLTQQEYEEYVTLLLGLYKRVLSP